MQQDNDVVDDENVIFHKQDGTYLNVPQWTILLTSHAMSDYFMRSTGPQLDKEMLRIIGVDPRA